MIISKQNRAYEYQHKDHHPKFSVAYTLVLDLKCSTCSLNNLSRLFFGYFVVLCER